MPSAAQLDNYQRESRAAYQAEYAILERERTEGQMDAQQYELAKSLLDKRVQDRADTMAWNRHALAQSEMKASGIPTPDQPIDLRAPGTGDIPNSMYSTPRNNAINGQDSGVLGATGAY